MVWCHLKIFRIVSLMIFIFSGLMTASVSHAASGTSLPIEPYTSIFRDKTGLMDFDQIKHADFKPVKNHLNFGYTDDFIWLRITLPAGGFSSDEWLMRVGIPYPDLLDVYQEINGETVRYDEGRSRSLESGPYPHRDIIVPVVINDGADTDLYMKVYSRDGTAVNADLETLSDFHKYDGMRQLFFGGYFGVMLAMAVYNFFLYLSLRQSRYLFYVIFTLAVTLNVSTHYKFLHQLFTVNNEWLLPRLNMVTFCIAIIASIQFVRHFLSTFSDMKRIDKLLKLFLMIFGGITVYALYAEYPSSEIMFLNLIPLLVLIAVAGILGLRDKRDPASSYFLVAFGIFITGVGLFSLRRFGIFAPSPSVNFTFMIGSVVETMLLSFALASQINNLRVQKERVQSELIEQMQNYNRTLEQMKKGLEETVQIRTSNLQRSLKEKDILLKEVHHRVKNNLSVITSLLGFQIMSESKDEKSASEALRAGCSRIESMALVHELLCSEENISEVNIREYFEKLLSNLNYSYGSNSVEMIINCDVPDISLHMDILVACGLIVTELVTNSLKHAFKDGRAGKVTLSLHAVDGEILLDVSDNGTGLDSRFKENLGMRLVRLMTEQLDGEMELDNSSGSRWHLRFPMGEI